MATTKTGGGLVTSYRQLDPPKPPRNKPVTTPGITKGGNPAEWLCWQVSALDLDEWQENRHLAHSDLRFLSVTVRDDNNNRIWPTPEKCIDQLGVYSRSALIPLLEAANELNFSDPEDAEKNSEEAKSDSSPSSSA